MNSMSCNDCMGKIETKMLSLFNKDLTKLSTLYFFFCLIRDIILMDNPPVLGMLSLCCNFP